MNIKNEIIRFLKYKRYEQKVFLPRYNDGERDLKKGLPNVSKPINDGQKKEIVSFWDKYLCSDRARKSFNIKWFDIYNTTNVDNHIIKFYIPDSFYYCMIDTFFSDPQKASIVDDKNLYDLYFHDISQPKSVVHKIGGVYLDSQYNIISIQDAINLCKRNGRVIIKPSVNACAGSGISYWQESDGEDVLLSLLQKDSNTIVQEVIKQHSVLAGLNDSSVNTLRIVTLVFNGKVYDISSVVIIGSPGAPTNHLHQGGLVCGILPNGNLRKTAFDGHLNQYDQHPNGTLFSSISIPNYKSCVEIARSLASRFCNVTSLISWDFTVDETESPVLIETNLTWGGLCQIANGPIFGDLTEDVLDYVKNHNGLK